MNTETHDAIIIGAGQAGPGVASHLAGQGQRVALVERGHVGGTCLNVGCRPTKAMRASARVAHLARQAARYGVDVPSVSVELERAVDRKDTMISGWRDDFVHYLESADGIELIRGSARFTGSSGDIHALEVDGRKLASKHVILNVGTRPRIPPLEGLDSVSYLTNESILELRRVPEHLIVLGGSYVGLEFAQTFRRFGAAVTVLERGGRILRKEDREIADEARRFLEAEGLTIRCETQATRAECTADGVSLTLSSGDTVAGDALLLAVGRVPNTDTLNLGALGVQTDEHGYIETDGVFRTGVPGVVALGDINGRGGFTHTSYQDGEIYVDHLKGGSRSVEDRILTYALFTDPPLGRVGWNDEQAAKSNTRVLRAIQPMRTVTKAALEGETYGVIKVLVDEDTDRFLGASCLGLFGDEIVQVVSAMMHADAPCRVLSNMLPIHPTVAEFFPTILNRLEPM